MALLYLTLAVILGVSPVNAGAEEEREAAAAESSSPRREGGRKEDGVLIFDEREHKGDSACSQ